MGIILIALAITVISAIGICIFNNNCNYDILSAVCCIINVISDTALVLLIIAVLLQNGFADSEFAQRQIEYETLTYQLDNNIYDNDNDIGLKELYNQIMDYNKYVIEGQTNQDKFIFKGFYAIPYDQLKLIELPQGE